MTMTNQPSSMTETSQSTEASKRPSKEGSSRYVQEKVMIALALVFFLGVIALTVVPAPFKDLSMGVIVLLTLVAMFKFN